MAKKDNTLLLLLGGGAVLAALAMREEKAPQAPMPQPPDDFSPPPTIEGEGPVVGDPVSAPPYTPEREHGPGHWEAPTADYPGQVLDVAALAKLFRTPATHEPWPDPSLQPTPSPGGSKSPYGGESPFR